MTPHEFILEFSTIANNNVAAYCEQLSFNSHNAFSSILAILYFHSKAHSAWSRNSSPHSHRRSPSVSPGPNTLLLPLLEDDMEAEGCWPGCCFLHLLPWWWSDLAAVGAHYRGAGFFRLILDPALVGARDRLEKEWLGKRWITSLLYREIEVHGTALVVCHSQGSLMPDILTAA